MLPKSTTRFLSFKLIHLPSVYWLTHSLTDSSARIMLLKTWQRDKIILRPNFFRFQVSGFNENMFWTSVLIRSFFPDSGLFTDQTTLTPLFPNLTWVVWTLWTKSAGQIRTSHKTRLTTTTKYLLSLLIIVLLINLEEERK